MEFERDLGPPDLHFKFQRSARDSRLPLPITLAVPARLLPSARLLALDVGSLKVGFAMSSPRGGAPPLVEGLGWVRAPPRLAGAPARSAYFAAVAAELASRHDAGGALLGWPLLPTGAPGASCAAVLAVRDALAASAPLLPLLLWDERGSTVAGRAALRAVRGGGPLPPEWRGGRVDEAAAVQILRSFFAAHGA